MTRMLLTALVLPAGLLLAGPTAVADEVTIEPSKDNTIFDENHNFSNGAGSFLHTGQDGDGEIKRCLVAFDVAAAVPAGSTITDVALTLRCSKTQVGSMDISLHRLLEDWGEGTSDAPGGEGGGTQATSGDATWAHTFYDADFWSVEGGTFADAASAATAVNSIGFYTWGSTAEMVADVQSWLDAPDTAFGWLLLNREDVRSTKRFDSRQSTNSSNRPMLTITFDPPADCPADVNGDEVVDIDDLFEVLANWGGGSGPADVDDSGVVDIDDVFAVLADWGDCP